MSNKTYIIGHLSPDLDSVAAAITYAEYKNRRENTDKYIPAAGGRINKVTAFVLEKFGINPPEIVDDLSGADIILVDHNEETQQVRGEDKNIIEILDHHKINFATANPITIEIRPLGSSNSLIYGKFKSANLEIGRQTAGLMLSAVLDDTVITKSPTTTDEDKKIIAELAGIAGIDDWQSYGIEMFKAKADVGALSEMDIIRMDFKDFATKAGKFGVGQIETVDLAMFKDREDKLITELEILRVAGDYHTAILFITDIIKEGSLFLVASAEPEKIEQALGAKLDNNRVYVAGIISHKKQVAPALMGVFDK